jgi:hypothetical protein
MIDYDAWTESRLIDPELEEADWERPRDDAEADEYRGSGLRPYDEDPE